MSEPVRSAERDDAAQRSFRCRICEGQGMRLVFHSDGDGAREIAQTIPDGRGGMKTVRIPTQVSAHCICPLGRWMRDKTDFATRRRIPDVAEILEGYSVWLLEPPGKHDPEARPMTRADINAAFKPF